MYFSSVNNGTFSHPSARIFDFFALYLEDMHTGHVGGFSDHSGGSGSELGWKGMRNSPVLFTLFGILRPHLPTL